MADIETSSELIQMLLSRLERISVDSYWAHRASGIRGALIRIAEQAEAGQSIEKAELHRNILPGFRLGRFSFAEISRM